MMISNVDNFCSMCGAPRYHSRRWSQDLNDAADARSRLQLAEVALAKERNTDKDTIIREQQEEIIRLRDEVRHLSNSWLQMKCDTQSKAITKLEEKIKRMKGLPYG